MAIGKRIEQRLKDLGWNRQDLLREVPELTPQALSNLIRRDSVRSEWDERIARALSVSVLWLVYGREPYSAAPNVTVLPAREPDPLPRHVQAIVDTALRMSPEGHLVLLGKAEELVERFPAAAKNLSY